MQSESNLLHCQRDSYLTESTNKVLRCEPKGPGIYSVLLDNSVLYAEGGGQPCDFGTINDAQVLKVSKPEKNYSSEDFGDANQTINLNTLVEVETTASFAENEMVTCRVDWKRRYDFMQQHTAQHLFSAIADKLFQAETVGWSLGADYVTVDLKAASILTSEQVQVIEDETNLMIRSNPRVQYKVVTREEFNHKLTSIRENPTNVEDKDFIFFRGEVKGAALELTELRLVAIEGLDLNPCGGTHLASLAEINLFIVTGIEKDTANTVTKVKFLAGERAINYFRQTLVRETTISQLLSSKPTDFVATIEKLLKDKKDLVKRYEVYNEELAYYYGKELSLKAIKASLASPEEAIVMVEHRYGADLKFLLRAGAAVFEQPDIPSNLLVILSGDENIPLPIQSTVAAGGGGGKGGKKDKKGDTADSGKGKSSSIIVPGKALTEGPFIIYGNIDLVNRVKDKVLELLQGRGGGRPGRLQGFATNLSQLPTLESILVGLLKSK